MRYYEKFMMMVPMACNSRIDRACRFLEDMGHSFLIEFGLDNAISIADSDYEGWDAEVSPEGAD